VFEADGGEDVDGGGDALSAAAAAVCVGEGRLMKLMPAQTCCALLLLSAKDPYVEILFGLKRGQARKKPT